MNSNTNQRARALMVWGTSSGAGKSYLVTALCRWAANRGIAVAPFKAQNMSNNARVVPDLLGGYGEIGSAQYFQALAAKVTPTVDMNPVLLKPEADTASQVVMHGQVNRALSKLPWRERSAELAVAARASLQRLQAHFELIVIEGAGSPAEINLPAHDYVNLETARWAEAQAVLIEQGLAQELRDPARFRVGSDDPRLLIERECAVATIERRGPWHDTHTRRETALCRRARRSEQQCQRGACA